jgi:hypothetical protein
LRIENIGAVPVQLLSVSPRIPEGVELLEVKDSSAQAAKLRHEAICRDLTELLRDHVYLNSKEI